MADPFSIFTGALAVADLCVRVGKYLEAVRNTAKNIPEEIEWLQREITTFSTTYTTLENICSTSTPQQLQRFHGSLADDNPCHILWSRAAELAQEGQTLVKKLKETLVAILGDESSTKIHKIEHVRKAVRLLSKEENYIKLRARFTKINQELSLMLTAIELASNSQFYSRTATSFEQLDWKLSQELQNLGIQLKQQIMALEKDDIDLQSSIVPAKAAIGFASLNKHFYVQKADTSTWTGRGNNLDTLRDALINPTAASERIQKRFVVYGIPGAGKTQFCCKFAQDYRASFWGIFWIDASSEQNAKESWKSIAKIGKKDQTDEAGKYWLSNLQPPWLLIIDNADDSEESIRSLFPSGERGCILITTRNRRLLIHATVGSLGLDRLEENEAIELLRKATKYEPWDLSARTFASSIAQRLHYLPLALVHAGRAIFHQLCTLQNYIPFFDKAFDDFRKKKHVHFLEDDDDDDVMGIFTTFHIIYSGLEYKAYCQVHHAVVFQDAIELVNIFAFLHSNDIKLDIFIKAGQNLRQDEETKTETEKAPPLSPPVSLLQQLEDIVAGLYMKFMRPAPALPRILRWTENQSFYESRIRKAVDMLIRMSLLSESSEHGSYSMHPLVHEWVRKRLRTSEQALWCGVAGEVLASAVKLPLMADETGDKDLYVRLLTHMDRVRSNKDDIRKELLQNYRGAGFFRSVIWSIKPPTLTLIDALNLAKYSRVYFECSKFSEAEKLLRTVQEIVIRFRGRDHPASIQMSMALSNTLWLLTRDAEAQELQEDALRICRSRLGENHFQTLQVMDALGETYWQRGWLKEAKVLHQRAIDGMEGMPDLKRARLKAMVHLGHVYEWNTEYEKAQQLHQEASDKLTEAYGADDLDTLMAKDSLAMILLQKGGIEQTKGAYTLMQDVYDRLFKVLGEEHLYTLTAARNLGRTLVALGWLQNDSKLIDDAKSIYLDGLVIATRNLGPNHRVTLMGRFSLTDTLVFEKKFEEAESEYKDIAERQQDLPRSRAGTHRDRLATLMKLIDSYEMQGRNEEAVQTCITVIEEIDAFGGQQHPWRLKMTEKQTKLLACMSVP